MPMRFHWSWYTAALVGAVALVAGGGFAAGRDTAPTPPPRVEYVVDEIPPACLEIRDALQAERARLATLEDAADVTAALAAGLPAVALTNNSEQILKHTEDLDNASRNEQEMRLELAGEMATVDDLVARCAPERAE